MKKLTVLCLAAHRERALDALGRLGVLHLVPVRPPGGGDLEKARAHLAWVRRALEVLPTRAAQGPSGMPAREVVETVWRVLHERKALEERLEEWRREHDRIAPFGSFDPAAVAELEKRGIRIRLLRWGPRARPAVPEGVVVRVLHRDRQGTYAVAVGKGAWEIEAEQVPLPAVSLAGLRRMIAEAERALADCDRQLERHAGDRPAVRALLAEAEEAVRYLEAREGMGALEPIQYLRGFCPVEAVALVREAAAREGWGLLVEDPAPGDPVPTLIRNPRWIQPIEALFEFIGILPGYDEVDVSASFLFFLSLFFAIIVGDAGYGLIFLLGTAWARRKFPQGPPRAFALMKIMSLTTIVWGVLTGNYFGLPNLPAPLGRLRVEWLGHERHLQFLAILLGAVHLTLAHLWNLVRYLNSPRALAQLGWIGTTWAMFFLAAALVVGVRWDTHVPCVSVLGVAFPKFMGPVFFLSLAAIALFMTPPHEFRKEWPNHIVLPLSIVSNFVDVVSYIRLYAVSLAGLAVASSFNAMIGGAMRGPFSGLLGALALFVVHGVNLVLSAMSVLVHGVRLNTLEFSSHLGLQWKGQPYAPFVRRAASSAPPGPAPTPAA